MTLEGMLGPNGRLDDAEGRHIAMPDALCVADGGRLLISSGSRILACSAWDAEPVVWASFDARVTALCATQGGLVAVGLEGGVLRVLDASGAAVAGWALPEGRLASIVDGTFRSDDELLLVDSGYANGDEVLARATWDAEAKGQVLSLKRTGQAEVLSSGLHAPMGICIDAGGQPLVTLLERAAIVDLRGATRQAGYPGYLGRLRRTRTGYALACLSRRDPLVEFLRTEPAFVADMMATVEPRHWIGPRISPEFSHDVPIELGATRLFGEVKPWAPSFSYGLLIGLDERLMPTGSAQSRANGRRHAICDAVEWNGAWVAVSKGSGEILRLAGGVQPS